MIIVDSNSILAGVNFVDETILLTSDSTTVFSCVFTGCVFDCGKRTVIINALHCVFDKCKAVNGSFDVRGLAPEVETVDSLGDLLGLSAYGTPETSSKEYPGWSATG